MNNAARSAVITSEEKKRKVDLSSPYEENGKWFVDETLYPESRGFIAHPFETKEAALFFIYNAE